MKLLIIPLIIIICTSCVNNGEIESSGSKSNSKEGIKITYRGIIKADLHDIPHLLTPVIGEYYISSIYTFDTLTRIDLYGDINENNIQKENGEWIKQVEVTRHPDGSINNYTSALTPGELNKIESIKIKIDKDLSFSLYIGSEKLLYAPYKDTTDGVVNYEISRFYYNLTLFESKSMPDDIAKKINVYEYFGNHFQVKYFYAEQYFLMNIENTKDYTAIRAVYTFE